MIPCGWCGAAPRNLKAAKLFTCPTDGCAMYAVTLPYGEWQDRHGGPHPAGLCRWCGSDGEIGGETVRCSNGACPLHIVGMYLKKWIGLAA